MNDKQLSAITLALQGHNIFLTGRPGTGKTFTIGKIVHSLHQIGRNVSVTASTGKAASVLKEFIPVDHIVTTIHRFSGILDGRYENEYLFKLVNTSDSFERQRKNILNVQTLVIDEISMISCKTLNQLEYLFRKIRNVQKPFGGIQVILSGDLYQLPPVPNLDYDDNGDFCINSGYMDHFHLVTLDQVHRQDEEDLVQTIHEVAR